jgi:copper(I)-binding protein
MSSTTRARTIAASLVAVLALGGLAACGSDSDTSSSTATTAGSGTLAVDDAWARDSATAAGNGAVYFTIVNGSGSDDELVSVSVPASVATEAHMHETVESTGDTTMSGGMSSATTMAGTGMMSMREVASVAVPAGQTVTFAPGGYHVMLMELATPLAAGTTIPVTLSFRTAGEITVTADVRAS